jgi:hypothetical protein
MIFGRSVSQASTARAGVGRRTDGGDEAVRPALVADAGAAELVDVVAKTPG